MKRKITILLIITILALLAKKSWSYYTKYRHAQRLKISIKEFTLPQLHLSHVLSDILANVHIHLSNYSNSTFHIEQINVDVYTPSGKLVAEQAEPLKQAINIRPNKNNTLPLTFYISATNINQLIQEAGGITKATANYLLRGKYGITFHLKGFVVAEGIPIDINEKITK